jgi:SAM-dependent methyltransferase
MAESFAAYDRRGYRTLGVVEGYAEWAASYDETTDDRLDIALLSSLASVDWKGFARAVDMACGTGRIGCWLHAHGVPLLDGIDISAAMLERAALKSVYDSLHCTDVALTGLDEGVYDLVVSSLAACHLGDLTGLYTEAVRLLGPCGRLVLVDYHPFMLLNGVPTHFTSGVGEPTAITNTVHLFSDHVQVARRVGLALVEMREQVVGPDWVADNPRMARHADLPISFVMVWARG